MDSTDPAENMMGTLQDFNGEAPLAVLTPVPLPTELSPSDDLSPNERLNFWAGPVRRLAAHQAACTIAIGQWLEAAKADFDRHRLPGHYTMLVEASGWTMDQAWKFRAIARKCSLLGTVPVPTSWSMKRRDAALRGGIRPTSRPDADNYIKAALDSINEIVIVDDSQIVEITAIKQYASIPQLKISIEPLPALTAQGKLVRP